MEELKKEAEQVLQSIIALYEKCNTTEKLDFVGAIIIPGLDKIMETMEMEE